MLNYSHTFFCCCVHNKVVPNVGNVVYDQEVLINSLTHISCSSLLYYHRKIHLFILLVNTSCHDFVIFLY